MSFYVDNNGGTVMDGAGVYETGAGEEGKSMFTGTREQGKH